MSLFFDHQFYLGMIIGSTLSFIAIRSVQRTERNRYLEGLKIMTKEIKVELKAIRDFNSPSEAKSEDEWT
jgi:hypothetical protein